MTKTDYRKQLENVMETVLDEYDLDELESYWDLGNTILGEAPVRRFYVHVEEGYGNVAVLTDTLVLDMEGETDGAEGGLVAHRVRGLGEVSFYEHPIPTIAGSAGAQLVVVASAIGSDEIGSHWIANTDEEYDYLVSFGQALVEAIANS